MKNRRVLIVSRGIPTKEEPLNGIFEWDQAQALKQAGLDVCFAVIDLRSIRKKRKYGIVQTERAGIPVFSVAVPIGPIRKSVFNWVGACAFKKLYNRIRSQFGIPDIIHAHFLDYGYMCSATCAHEKIPFVLTDHTSDYNCICDISQYAKGIYEQADAVIAVSSDMQARILKWTGVTAHVVHNMTDFNIPDVVIDRQNSVFRFVSAGNLVPEKNFGSLIRAFERISDKQCELTIYGDGPERVPLEKLAEELHLSDRVHFMGKVQRKILMDEYSQYDAFALVSKQETFGVAYIEALALGLPVIATINGGPNDFVNEKNGILVGPNNEEDIAAALQHMISHCNEYDRKSFSEEIRREFSAEALAGNLVDIYSKIYGK